MTPRLWLGPAAVRRIEDPVARAVAAVELHVAVRCLSAEVKELRREALRAAKASGLTWDELAQTVGLSLKAVGAAVRQEQPEPGQSWHRRIPVELAGLYKRGPGGMAFKDVVHLVELKDAIVAVLAEGPHSRQSLHAALVAHFGRAVPIPSLGIALRTLVDDGLILRVRTGVYDRISCGDRRRTGPSPEPAPS